MRSTRRYVLLVSVTITAGLALSGCVSDEHTAAIPSAASLPASMSPSTVSDEESARVEAQQLLDQFGSKFVRVFGDPTMDVSVLSPLVTPDGLENLRGLLATYRTKGITPVGVSTYSVGDTLDFEGDAGTLSILACKSNVGVRLLDADGTDVTSPTRPDSQTMKVDLKKTSDGWRIDGSSEWSGDNIC